MVVDAHVFVSAGGVPSADRKSVPLRYMPRQRGINLHFSGSVTVELGDAE
jgi:hypothetical protein